MHDRCISIGPPRNYLQTNTGCIHVANKINDTGCIHKLTVIIINVYICNSVVQSRWRYEKTLCFPNEPSSNNSETKGFTSLNDTIISKLNPIFSRIGLLGLKGNSECPG